MCLLCVGTCCCLLLVWCDVVSLTWDAPTIPAIPVCRRARHQRPTSVVEPIVLHGWGATIPVCRRARHQREPIVLHGWGDYDNELHGTGSADTKLHGEGRSNDGHRGADANGCTRYKRCFITGAHLSQMHGVRDMQSALNADLCVQGQHQCTNAFRLRTHAFASVHSTSKLISLARYDCS